MNTTYSPQYQSLYFFFQAAATASRMRPLETSDSYCQDVIAAFKATWHGLNNERRSSFVQHTAWLLERLDVIRDTLESQRVEEETLALAFSATSAELLEAGQLVTESEYRNSMQLTSEEFQQKLREHRIFILWRYPQLGLRENFVPAFFLDTRYNRRELELISMELTDVNEFRAYKFLTAANDDLDGLTPLEFLLEGSVADVLDAIRNFRCNLI